MIKRLFVFLISTLLISACATTPASLSRQAIKVVPANDIQLAEVKAEPETFMGTAVRWGGKVLNSKVIKTDAGNELIRLEVLQYDLDDKARPYSVDSSEGRFVAHIPKPEKKRILKNRFITVLGKVTATEDMQVNEDNYVTLPVLDSEDYYIWYRSRHHYHNSAHYSPHYFNSYRTVYYYPHGHRLHVHGAFCW